MSGWVAWMMPHLMVAPILLPMLTAAVLLLMGEGRRPVKATLSVGSAVLGLAVSVELLGWVETCGRVVYLPGNWPAPFGIALVADRLAVLMLVLTSLVGLCALLFAAARWDKAGVHFYPLMQLQLMGLSGAFLTGDLFNLFVFFEIMLAASYGLLLHGSGRPRVRASVHYVAINLAASSLFLIGASMLYGVTGTLNMADLSLRAALVPEGDRGLFHAAAGILAVAFLAKAAAWPLNFWLVPAYTAATAPVAGFFALLTKVGVYALLRMWTLLFSEGPSAGVGSDGLLLLGLVSGGLGALGMLGSQRLGHLAAYSVVVSAGTLVAAMSFGRWALTGGALFYLLSSTLAAAALFLLIDLVERWRNSGATVDDVAPFLNPSLQGDQAFNLDDDEERLVGRPFPASTALLGLGFMTCTLLVAGLPPLSSFVGKLGMLSGALGVERDGAGVSWRAWNLVLLLLGGGLASLIAMTRTGIRLFWSAPPREPPRLRLAEGLPVAALLGACLALTAGAGPAMAYMNETAQALHAPRAYVDAVLEEPTVTRGQRLGGRCVAP
ncbi:monovalent cation/H+ antiporter subunit D [Pyxidicoccus xibeiensis]|uniref:monovalent cation/H+ antiporter subunit D n=1 Tax=Pyxidicoccus xibeiensis TaxID=2906759 RepID=UPI0020A797C5|nr:monovalent cation/H+ antiporter subunit D [Pyxidicoccus xibeiensis]MCP3138817.1 monovalent cation/H+ antiporter subunit D [Pyxidicoccus xibeiensis]